MPSTATSRLRLEKQALGENSSTWGAPKLNDVFDRLDEAIGGVESIAIAGTTTTLTSANYSTDQARKAALIFTGTLSANSNVIVPNVEKLYLCINNTSGSYSLTIKTSGGTGYALRSGPNWVYCDGTNVVGAVPRLDQVPLPTASVDANSQRITNLGTPSSSTDAANKAYVDAAVSTTPTQSLATSSGTALAPTYSWASDSDTGMYNVGANSLGLSAGGTVRATVSSTGLAVSGVFSASGAATLSGGLGVTGAITTTGGVSVGTTLGVTGATTMGSTLGVTGATTLAALSATTGTFSSTLGVTGAATLSSTLAVTSNATVGGTLGVTGAVTASAGITVSGSPLRTAAGLAATPSHSFSGDTDTGLFSAGTDAIGISTGGTERVRINGSGQWQVGQTSTVTPGYSADTTVGFGVWGTNGRLFVSQDSFSNWGMNSDGILIALCRSGAAVGNISVTTTGANFNTSSDYRLKENFEPLTEAATRLMQLKPKRFNYKADKKLRVDGFIAHEVQKVIPEAVTGEKDGEEMQGLDKSRMIPLMVAAIQELVGRVETLEKAAGKAK